MILKAYKFKLKHKAKLYKLHQFTGCCRFVWNKALALQLERLNAKEKLYSYRDLASMLVDWKRDPDTSFLKDANAQGLQQTLKDLDRAFKDGFSKKQPDKRIPVFKRKGKCVESFRIPTAPNLNGNAIFLPKIGWCTFFKSMEIEGTPKNFTISKGVDGWYVSIQVEIDRELMKDSEKILSKPVGIDVGVNKHAAPSSGEIYQAPAEKLKALEQKKKHYQKELARRKKFGSNWRKTVNKISKTSSKIARIRNDYLHKTSTGIIKNHDLVVVEDLKVKHMTKSAKGSADKPGTNVKIKARLNREMLSQGWGEFFRQLSYKAEWSNGMLVKVNPAYTSQTCSECGYVDKKNRKTQESFECQSCGFECNADINAAINILRAGQALSGEIGRHKAA
jgi:putative transposase